MTSAEIRTAWRAEIESELAALELEFATARSELAAAEGQIAELKDEFERLAADCARGVGTHGAGLGPGVWSRLQAERQKLLRDTGRLRGGLPARCKSLEERIADRRLELGQLTRSLEAEQPRHVPEVVVRPGPALLPSYRITKAASG